MKTRDGFTLVEVIIAILLLAMGVLGLQLVAATMVRNTSLSQTRLSAAQLAEDRIDVIKLEPMYANIAGYAATETTLPGFPNFRRVTTVDEEYDSTAAGITDYKRITVAVSAPGLTTPILRVITIGAP